MTHCIRTSSKDIRFDDLWTVIFEMRRYATKTVLATAAAQPTPSFALLCEDIIRSECLVTQPQQDPGVFLSHWEKTVRGIIRRVWFSEEEEADAIKRIRAMLRFFPTPYQLQSPTILPVLHASSDAERSIMLIS